MPVNKARYDLMIRRLLSFQRLLASDNITPVRISMNFLATQSNHATLDNREFVLTITGITSPIIAHGGYTYGDTFRVRVKVPEGFPETIPEIKFEQTIPFHPHVYCSGHICWGSHNVGSASNPSLTTWVVNLLYYLEYNQNPAYQMNVHSPANTTARDVYLHDRNAIIRQITQANMHRVVRCATLADSER